MPPRRLQPGVPRDLETICLKCLEKDPARRYATAAELADDLGRFLAGDPIAARPAGRAERAIRWARRRPTAAALIAVCALATAVLLIGGWLTSARLGTALETVRDEKRRADDLRVEAETAADLANRNRILAETHAAEADKQRLAVAANLQHRLDVVDDILFNMDARLENLSGLESVRREFLDEVRRFSDQLLKENPDDPSVMRQAGACTAASAS